MRKIGLALFLFMTCLHASLKHNVGVFCATDEKVPDVYKNTAFEFGKALAQSDFGLVTGGGNTGLMNAVVNGFVFQDDAIHLHGVIPSLFKELNVHHSKIPVTNLIWTDTIHQRLKTFQEKCDTLVVLPGGIGTLHELMDFLVPKQWGLLKQKIILLNVDHYWDHLLLQFQVMVEKNALKQQHLDLLIVATTVEECIATIQAKDLAGEHKGLDDRYWENSDKK